MITNSSALPITGFLYGNLVHEIQYAAITVGRMLCEGRKRVASDSLMDSCSKMKLDGITTSGNYVLNNNSVSFCDMSKLMSDPLLQKHIGNLHYHDNDVL